MKKYIRFFSYPLMVLLGIMVFMTTTKTINAQVPPSRVAVVDTPPPPFMPDEVALKNFIGHLEATLTCKETFSEPEFQNCFFSLEDTKNYIQFLEKQAYPRINEQAVPIFYKMTKSARDELGIWATDNIDGIKLLGTQQSFGDSEAMKRIVVYVHLYMASKEIRGLQLMLLDFDGVYKILSIDS